MNHWSSSQNRMIWHELDWSDCLWLTDTMASEDSYELLLWTFFLPFLKLECSSSPSLNLNGKEPIIFLKFTLFERVWNNIRERKSWQILKFLVERFSEFTGPVSCVMVSMDVSASRTLNHTEGILTASLSSCWRFSLFLKSENALKEINGLWKHTGTLLDVKR